MTDGPVLHHGDRLQKVLAAAGVASRRNCEILIEGGHITVNGEIAILGRRVDPTIDLIEIDGIAIGVKPGLVYYLINKPVGVITTASDPEGRSTVVDFVPPEPRVFPVGRLDVDTEGLLILTNDGELTHRLTHPSFGVDKEYLAHVQGKPNAGALKKLREGVELEDGFTAPAKVGVVAPSLLRIVIHEGRNRQVRRMCEAVGHPVVRLIRARIGPLRDDQLQPGEMRQLTQVEVRSLEQAASGKPSSELNRHK